MDALSGGSAARFVVEAVGVALVCLVVYKRVAQKFVAGCATDYFTILQNENIIQ